MLYFLILIYTDFIIYIYIYIHNYFLQIFQKEGEIIITFPYGYHSGYNNGFNVAETTNFVLPRWIEYGKRSTRCPCHNGAINLSMDTFVKNSQKYKYQDWVAGRDFGEHPEDPS